MGERSAIYPVKHAEAVAAPSVRASHSAASAIVECRIIVQTLLAEGRSGDIDRELFNFEMEIHRRAGRLSRVSGIKRLAKMKQGTQRSNLTASPVDSLIVTRRNRVAEICMDPEAIARNAESVRRAAREYIDDGSDRATKKVSGTKSRKGSRR
jgi:hypothetical protein